MNVYESSYIVNSFHAVDGTTGEVITASSKGVITLNPGQKVVFASPYNANETVYLNTIVFDAKSDMKIQLNDNDMYPLFIAAGQKKGVRYIRINSFTAVTSGQLSYEGMGT